MSETYGNKKQRGVQEDHKLLGFAFILVDGECPELAEKEDAEPEKCENDAKLKRNTGGVDMKPVVC
jgi:hypothetical protein